jgi:hypothetical protein
MGILPSNQKDRKYMLMGFRITGDFGATIAFPLIFFVIIGQWLDDKYNKEMLFTVLAFVISALLSGYLIYKKAKKYGVEYQEIDNIK